MEKDEIVRALQVKIAKKENRLIWLVLVFLVPLCTMQAESVWWPIRMVSALIVLIIVFYGGFVWLSMEEDKDELGKMSID